MPKVLIATIATVTKFNPNRFTSCFSPFVYESVLSLFGSYYGPEFFYFECLCRFIASLV